MKLLNRSVKLVAIPMLTVIGLWAVVFYFNIIGEIKKSVDEGLDNYKRQIVFQAESDSALLEGQSFEDSFYSVRAIDVSQAQNYKDTYRDTIMYMQDADDLFAEPEPMRMLSTIFEIDGSFYELKIVHSMIEEDDLVKQLFWNLTGLLILMLLTIIFINNFGLRQVWDPFYVILSRLKTYRLGKSDEVIAVDTKTTEFNELQNAVNILLKHSISVYEQQRQFIGNASHELQTPLAIVVNKLELLIERDDLNDGQAEIIGDTIQLVERLIRINKSLLLLSKIENHQFVDNREVSINEIVRQAVGELEDIALYKNIEVSLIEKSDIQIEADVSLAHIVVANLIRNALFHNVDGGVVEIKIRSKGLFICNTGVTKPLDQESIFNRFEKSIDRTEGTGLGLAIVKAVCELYDYSITYEYRNERHCFELSFAK